MQNQWSGTLFSEETERSTKLISLGVKCIQPNCGIKTMLFWSLGRTHTINCIICFDRFFWLLQIYAKNSIEGSTFFMTFCVWMHILYATGREGTVFQFFVREGKASARAHTKIIHWSYVFSIFTIHELWR